MPQEGDLGMATFDMCCPECGKPIRASERMVWMGGRWVHEHHYEDEIYWECESCGYFQVSKFYMCPECGEEKFISTVTWAQSEG